MNIEIENVKMDVLDGAYRLREDEKTLGYYPSFRDMLSAFADTEIGKVNASGIDEIVVAMDRIEKAVHEAALRHQVPPRMPKPNSEAKLRDKPVKLLSAVERAFIEVNGRRSSASADDEKDIGKIISMHAMASKMTDKDKSDIYRCVALNYYGYADASEFKKLPQARELVTEIKAILKPWFEDQEKS
jgi:hypothetical protein